jgi:hypothetical protein
MSAFENPPLLCESYVEDSRQHFIKVSCPWPTSLHIYGTKSWEPNTASLQCNGNNNTICAQNRTPLTRNVYTTIGQLLERIDAAESLLIETTVVENCTFASNAALDVWKDTCEHNQLRTSLMGAWITCTIVAACALGLAPLLLIVVRGLAPSGISQVDVVYGPGENPQNFVSWISHINIRCSS